MFRTLQYDGFRWFFKQASTMAAEPHSGLVVEDGAVDLMIPVSKLRTIDIGIKEALAPLINHFCESLRGILIAYSHLKVLSPFVDLSADANEVEEVRVNGTFAIFRPQREQILEGVITRVDPHYVGCLVHKNFAASLQSESGSNVNFRNVFHPGQTVKFRFSKLENHNGISSLRGYLSDQSILDHRQSKPQESSPSGESSRQWHSDMVSGSDGVILQSPGGSGGADLEVTPDSGVGADNSLADCSVSAPDPESDGSVARKRKKLKKKSRETQETIEPLQFIEPGSPVVEASDLMETPKCQSKKKRKRSSIDTD